MILKKLSVAAGAVALASAPIAASASGAAFATETAPVAGESELGEGIGIGAILMAAIVVGLAIVLFEDDDENNPVSV